MQIIKRDGSAEEVKFDKIVNRIKKQCYELDTSSIGVDFSKVALTVFNGLYDGVTSVILDNLAAESAASLIAAHPDYSILASRIAITSLHKQTSKSFSQTIKKLHDSVSTKTGKSTSSIADDVYEFIMKNKSRLDSAIIYDRDLNFEYFGFKTLERAYLLKSNGEIVERPQHLWMRVACGIWCGNIEETLKTYELLSTGMFTHATPTLFNSGTKKPQLSSCFLLSINDDSITDIYKTLSDIAAISKYAGGIGLSISKIRATGAEINGTGGVSNGIVPMLKVFNETARYVDQGGGKRKGSFAIYLEPWHADVFDFLDLRKNTGKEEMRARDLFLALWTPDLFMQRVQDDGDWSLFSPDEAPNLDEVYGEQFEKLYTQYEQEGRARKTIKARDLWLKIQESQIETGTPYIVFKDASNQKSNQKNLGTIKSSNLCTEIIEYNGPDEQAVCNLASIALPKFVIDKQFDHNLLYEVTYQVAKNLDQVIDRNFYPTIETQNSNFRHRPIAIGAQGLADVFAMMDLAFDSPEAAKLNKEISETIYYASVDASADLAITKGSYSSFEGSPMSKGIFQFDMWEEREVGPRDGRQEILSRKPVELSGRWDWAALRHKVMSTGLRNSLLVAYMPTASTSQILGNNECFEPYTSNIYTRRVLSGEYIIVNKHLVKDLIKLGLWSLHMKAQIIAADGSVQNIAELPQWIRDKYKTTYEIKQKVIIDMAADRGYFTDQALSMNLFFANVNYAKLSSALIYGWLKGLKTGCYYTRTLSIVGAIKGLGQDMSKYDNPIAEEQISCSLDNPEGCISCGS